MIELAGAGSVERATVGSKAYHLNQLMSYGIRVPPTVVIPADRQGVEGTALLGWLERTMGTGPWSVAVRSSSADEDTSVESKAGHFLSLLGTFDPTSIIDAVHRVRQSGPNMAVAIQPLLVPKIAGVLFSCDPVTYSRENVTIDWTRGLADRLVAGDEAGKHLRLFKDGGLEVGEWPDLPEARAELVRAARAIEARWEAPVDIEWVVDRDDKVWLVQARHVVLPEPRSVPLGRDADYSLLPMLVREHPKIRLRRRAAISGVTMAPAVVQLNSVHPSQYDEELAKGFKRSVGVSVVLLHPERIEQQVVRDFAPVRGSDVDFFTRTCRRYAVRRYPGSGGVAAAMKSTGALGLTTSWVSVVLVQAVWDAYATGIIQRTDDGYVIEMALGHFVPKGVVPTSTVVLDRDRTVVSEVWHDQPTVYHFIDGHVVTETPPREQLRLGSATLASIASTLDPLFEEYGNPVLEFGILNWADGESVYLIDAAEGSSSGRTIDVQSISSGVLSPGSCCGRVSRVDVAAAGALDSHLYDQIAEGEADGDPVVVVAERASVDLLRLVGVRGVVGFVFRRGSVLAHLAVVLRERGIPALTLEDDALFESLLQGKVVELDASPGPKSHRERVRIV